jgi:hypothetical protein
MGARTCEHHEESEFAKISNAAVQMGIVGALDGVSFGDSAAQPKGSAACLVAAPRLGRPERESKR